MLLTVMFLSSDRDNIESLENPLSLQVRHLLHCIYKSAENRELFVGNFTYVLVLQRF